MNKKGDLSLETVGKAVLVLVVIVILILLFRQLLGNSGENFNNINNDVGDKTNCITNPNAPDCQDWLGIGNDGQGTNPPSSQGE